MRMVLKKYLLIIRCRYLPRILRKRHRQGCTSHLMAPSTRISLHSVFHPHGWNLLLPRVTSLVDEAR